MNNTNRLHQTDLPDDSLATDTGGTADVRAGISLHELMGMVSEVIREEFFGATWVRAEISQYRPIRGDHYAIELVEHGVDGSLVARAQAFMWRGVAPKVTTKFKAATGGVLAAGIKVMLSVKVEFSAAYGFRLIIQDIEPSFTLGDIQAKLKQIRDNLTKEGVIDGNRRLPVPGEFCKVAVISPDAAAGLGDFKGDADILEKAGLCCFHYVPAIFQGVSAPGEIKACLSSLLGNGESYDAICIIRGGGSVTDLYWLNDLDLARAVCSSQVPIFTGIGHERDNTALDELANKRFDTPSKLVAHIRDVICGNATRAEAHFQEAVLHSEKQVSRAEKAAASLLVQIQAQANHQLSQMAALVDQLEAGLLPSVQLILSDADNKLEQGVRWIESKAISLLTSAEGQVGTVWQQVLFEADRRLIDAEREMDFHYRTVMSSGQDCIKAATNQVEAYGREILGLGPQATLRRGFAIVRDNRGVPVASKSQALHEGTLNIEFRDGRVDVKTQQ